MKKYSELIFGGIQRVKELYVEELRNIRTKKGLLPEELDALLRLGSDWPTVREVEDDPRLFTRKLYQAVWHPEAENDDVFVLNNIIARDPLSEKIISFLSNKEMLEQVLGEFRASVKVKIGEKTKINSVSPEVYAQAYIFASILDELAKAPLPAS